MTIIDSGLLFRATLYYTVVEQINDNDDYDKMMKI